MAFCKECNIHDWRAREATRDRVRQLIYDTLCADATGLPESYSDNEIETRTDSIFSFVLTHQAPEAVFV